MDKITFLTPNILSQTAKLTDPLYSRLLAAMHEIRQEKATAGQWLGMINGLSQKGVKSSEIEDSGILDFLNGQPPEAKLEKQMLNNAIGRRLPRIKCVDLGSPKFSGWRNIAGGKYQERLYILSSEGMQADDEMESLLYRIEELGFNPGPLITDPGLVDKLELQMNVLKQSRPKMYDFAQHHFSGSMKEHGKNLMAHARTLVEGDLFFVEEMQSDWAQRGRQQNWTANFPKAPFVTNTEQWSGLVLRDLLHTAAENPACKRFAWINSNMRNGWSNTTGESDGLDTFYSSIVKKMAEKCISKAGGRILPMEIATKNGPKTVLGFEMTDAVRDSLKMSLPLYSREGVLPRGVTAPDPDRNEERTQVIKDCQTMLGTAHTIRFTARLYDISQGNEVPGQYFNKGITLSLRAKNLNRTARHEAWHFADENFLYPHEKRELRLAFTLGSPLNQQTRQALRDIGAEAAALQCVDEKECAAHAFSLWCEGRLPMEDSRPKSIFQAVAKSLSVMADWLEGKIFGIKVQSPEDLFTAMRTGVLAVRQAHAEQETVQPRG